MAAKRRSKAISKGMKKYHKKTTKKKSSAGTRKAALTRWGKRGGKRKKK